MEQLFHRRINDRGGQRRYNQRNSGGFGGGGGGGSGGGNSGGGNRRQNYGSGNQVNPWQGGVTPGGSQIGGLGLLPRPSQSGVLSQLSSPEAQLAMATNLLNKILSPQQSSSNVPSLLSLPMNGNMSYGDSYSRGSYADRHRDRAGDRRMQPYSKSGLNRRGDVKSRLGKSRISDRSSSSKPKKRDSDDKEDKQNGDGSVDDKREDGDKKEEDEADKVKYTDVPSSLLSCHVCHKNMWDSCSFEKHISGRRHQMMMEKLDETYKIKVELLRHEQRSAESQRELEIERLERQGKKIFNNKREYCTMCDLHFYGNLISHRKKDRHQKLKSFLHPKCHLCHKEFPNRLEFDDHKLTGSHMLKISEYYTNTRPSVKEEDMDANEVESLDGGDVSVFDEIAENFSKEKKKLLVNMDEFPTEVEEYDAAAPLGVEYVAKAQGHFCKLCNKFISTEEKAAVHARTLTHYKNYAAVVKMKVKAEKDKEAAEKAAESKARREGGKKNRKGTKDGDKEDDAKEDKMDDEVEGEEEEETGGAAEEVPEEKEVVEEKMEVDAAVAAEDKTAAEEGADEVSTPRGRGKATRGRRGAPRRGK